MAATPPAFNPGQQRKSGSKLWVWLILAVVFFCILVIVAIGFVIKSLAGTLTGMMACAVNGELATNAVLAYAIEHDGQLPNAETWQTEVMPNYERLYDKRGDFFDTEDFPDLFSVDTAKPGSVLICNPAGPNETGFAFNAALSGQNMDDIGDLDDVILIWETKSPMFNASGDPSGRSDNDPALKLFNESRSWMDFMASGDLNPGAGDNMDFRMDINPEDGLADPSSETPE